MKFSDMPHQRADLLIAKLNSTKMNPMRFSSWLRSRTAEDELKALGLRLAQCCGLIPQLQTVAPPPSS